VSCTAVPAKRYSPWLVGAAVLALTTQFGCAPYRWQETTEPPGGEVVINPPPGPRGNPPVYEVLGQRYYVQGSSAGHRERGVASWYGKDFHGLSTASGETYDMHALTAAHRTLPIPTWVEVTHVGNGRRVIVKVNDRGPFVDDRIIDLSYAAAEELGMVRQGTATVEVRALGVPAVGTEPDGEVMAGYPSDTRPSSFSIISEAAAGTPGPQDRPMQRIFVQVGAFAEYANASKLVDALKAGGYEEAFVVSDGSARRTLHRVRIGPLDDVRELDDLVADLSSLGVHETHLVVVH